MDGRNDREIVDSLKKMADVLAQAYASLLDNQIQNGEAGEFQGLRKFQKNNLPMFKGI